MSHAIIDLDPNKKLIDARAKDGKSYEVDGDSRFCGHRFILKQKLYGDKRCLYCGKWFHWDQKDQYRWIRTSNLDPYNADDNLEPLHCGSAHCADYHHLCQTKQSEADKQMEERTMAMFKTLKQRKVL